MRDSQASIKRNNTVANFTHSGSWKLLPLFFLFSFAVFSFGGLFQPGDWYQSINKAPWTPPNLVFPIVWAFLYLFIAIAGWQIFSNQARLPKVLWALQLALNALWSWLFFGQHWTISGLIDLLLLDALVLSLIGSCWQSNMRMTAYLLGTYLIWLSLATSLNIYIVAYN